MSQRVIVVGLGGAGSAVAADLAQRGVEVVGFDRFTPPHVHGSSHGRSRIIRRAYFEGAETYQPLLTRAYELWADLGSRVGAALMTTTGGLFLGDPDAEVVAGTMAAAEAGAIPHEVLDAVEVRHRFPALRPRDEEVAVYEPGAGLLDPEASVRAHLGLATAAGADLRTDTTVTRWDADGDGVSVTTAAGASVDADRLVLCPGAWAPALLRLDVHLEVERQVMCWFHAGSDEATLQRDRLPVFVWERVGDRVPVYGAPGLQGEGVKLAFHHGGAVGGIDDLDATVRDDDVQPLRDVASERIPILDVAPSDAAVCRYTNTRDHRFLLGWHPDAPNVAIAAGFSGHGFKFTPVVGEAIGSLVTDGTGIHDLRPFDPGRFRDA